MLLADAERIAEGLAVLLRPATERIEIAGSIRRRKPSVKDIEIVCTPRFRSERAGQASLLDDEQGTVYTSLPEEMIESWMIDGTARARLDKNGRHALGRSYKRLLIDYGEPGFEAVPLDLFIVRPPAQWGLILMIRTGSGVGPDGNPQTGFGPAMLSRWKAVSGGGESRGGCLYWGDGAPCETLEEEDVFRVCKVAWVPPEERVSAEAVRRNAHD